MNLLNFTTVPPLALYVHVPWCVRKCPYCDFNSHPLRDALPERAYVDALLEDLELELPAVWGRTVHTVFFGGGTPSLLSPEAVDRLLSGLRARLNLAADAEITLEANPGTVDEARFAGFRAAGINRLSIGIQSFDDARLAAIGRIHGGADALRAVEAARAAGFDNLNLDLMHGLPGQTPATALADLEQALAFAPEHLSWYQLTLEPNTAFERDPPALPEDDDLWAIQEAGLERLAAAGYGQYEVSAHARPGRQCRHNRNYWLFGDYLGIGAGAHGKVTEPALGRIVRRRRVAHPTAYLSETGSGRIAEERTLARAELPFEFMLNALRLREGFATALFDERTGMPIAAVERPLREAERSGLLTWDPFRIAPTSQGWRFLNDLIALFLP